MPVTTWIRSTLASFLILGSVALGAQSPSPDDAKAFLGSWTVSVDAGGGPLTLTMNLKDAGGKVVGDIGGGDVPVTAFTDIAKNGANLVMKYSADVGGMVAAIILTAEPPTADKLSLSFDVGGMALPASATKAK